MKLPILSWLFPVMGNIAMSLLLSVSGLLFIPRAVSGQVTFTDVSATAGTGLGDGTARGIAWCDYNNDGLQDLFVPTQGGIPNKIYRNNGNGTFTDVAAMLNLNDQANTITCSWADFENDGDMDLLTTATAAPTRLWRNNRNAGIDTTFTSIEGIAGISMTGAQMPVWADFNSDGFVDFYSSISNSASTTDALYRNNGNGTFTNVADSAAVNHMTSGVLEQAVSWGDYNSDGLPDLFIGNLQTGGPSFFHRNNGNGTFSEVAATLGFTGSARGSQWVDYNNDGLLDFSVAAYAGGTTPIPVKLFRNNGNGTFMDVAAASGLTDAVISWGVAWADYDNDGYEDCFVAVSGQSTSCLLYRNNGNGTFTNATNQAGLSGLVQLSAAWADYDNDGDMDLYSSGAASGGNHLLRNNGDTTHRWIAIDLVGSQSNRSGIGARIAISAGSLRMVREVHTGVGYRAQSMMTVHAGLNTNATVDSIVVRWPSGSRSVLRNVVSNQRISIHEGTTNVGWSREQPAESALLQNYPNPFNPSTTIRYAVAHRSHVTIVLYDALGRISRVLADNGHGPGVYELVIDASTLPSGVYFCRMTAGGLVHTRKLLVMK